MDITKFNFIQFTDEEASRGTELQGLIELHLDAFTEVIKNVFTEDRQTAAIEQAFNSSRKNIELAEKYQEEYNEIAAAAEQRYINRLKNNKKQLMADAKKVLEAATLEDFEELRQSELKKIKMLETSKGDNTAAAAAADNARKHFVYENSYKGYKTYLLVCLRLQLNAIEYYNLSDYDLMVLVEKQAAKYFTPTDEDLKNKPKRLQEGKDFYRTGKPVKAVWPVDRVTNDIYLAKTGKELLTELEKNKGKELEGQYAFTVIVGGKETNSPVKALVSLDLSNVKSDKPLTRYHQAVIAGVAAQVEAGNTCITPKMLIEAMSGGKAYSKGITPVQEAELDEAVQYLSNTNITIDYTQEVNSHFIKPFTKPEVQPDGTRSYTLSGKALEIRTAAENINGKAVKKAYKLLAKPMIYEYAKNKAEGKGHIDIRDIKYLDTGLPFNKVNEGLKASLYSRVIAMKRTETTSHYILFNDLYDELELIVNGSDAIKEKGKQLSKTEKARIREKTEKILNCWAGTEIMHSFTPYYKGRAVQGIRVFMSEAEAKKYKANN